MKRIICILLTVLLLFGMFSVCAYAEDEVIPSEGGSDITPTTDPSTDPGTDPSTDPSTVPSTEPTEPEEDPIIIPDDDGVKRAMITVPGIDPVSGLQVNLQVIVEAGDAPVYLFTDENGRAFSAGATEENYHIKLEYPTEGMPTVSLRNAKLINSKHNALTIGGLDATGSQFIADFPCTISVEADSELVGRYDNPRSNGSYSAIVFKNGGSVLITGPGKLTLTSEGMFPLLMEGNNLVFQDANVVAFSLIAISRGVRPAIWVKNGSIQINNSRVHAASNSGAGILISDSVSGVTENPGESYFISMSSGSYVTVSCPESYCAAIGCKGDIGVYDSTLEITAKVRCFQPEPFLVNVTAVAGANKAGATAYNEEKAFDYTYFRSTPTRPGFAKPEPDEETLPTMPETEPETEPETVPETQPEKLPQQNTSENKRSSVILIVCVAVLLLLTAAESAVVTILVMRRYGFDNAWKEWEKEYLEDLEDGFDEEPVEESQESIQDEFNEEPADAPVEDEETNE